MLSYEELLQQNSALRAELEEAAETLRAIRSGEVDALLVATPQGDQVFTLKSADHPYRVLIEEMKSGALTLTDNGTILYCNHYFANLLNRATTDIISQPIYAFFDVADAPRLQHFLHATQSDQTAPLELNLLVNRGDTIPIQLAANTLYFDHMRVTCLVVTDLRVQKQREAEITLLQDLSLEITQAPNLHTALHHVLQRLVLKTDWDMGEAWLCDRDEYHRVVGWHHLKTLNVFDAYSQNLRLPLGQGLIGRIWSKSAPVWFPNIADQPSFVRQQAMLKAGIHAGVGIPIVMNAQTVAVLIFFSTKPLPEDHNFIQLISTVISHLGTYIVQKQVEEQIRYQAKFLETVRDPIISTDPDSIILSWNHAAEVTYGWSAAEVIGKRYRDVLSHEYPHDTPEGVTKSFLENRHWTGEVIQTTRSGRKLHALASITMMRDEIGKPIRAVITHRDITDRKQEENKIRENEERLRVAIMALDVAVFNQDRDLRYTWIYHPQLDYQVDDVVGKTDAELLPEGDAEKVMRIKRQAIDNNQGDRQEITVTTNGKTIYYDLTVEPLHDAEGQVIGITGATLDITERKQVEKAIIESERFARSTVDALSAQIAILDETGTIMAVNREWQDHAGYLGKKPDNWVGQNYITLCQSAATTFESARDIANGIQKIIHGDWNKDNHFTLQYSYPASSGTVWFNMRITPFLGEGPLRLVVAHENITGQKLVENALLDAHQQLVTLNRIMTQTSTTLDTRTLLELACEELGNVFEAPQVTAGIFNEDKTSLNLVAGYSSTGSSPLVGKSLMRTPERAGTNAFVYMTPTAIKDVRHDPNFAYLSDFINTNQIVSMLIIPLIAREKNIGLIGVYTHDERVFTKTELALAGSIAQAIAPSLENSLLHTSIADQNILLEQTIEKRTGQLKRLYERMSTILDNTSDAIILTTSAGQIENTNLAFDNLFQYDRDEMLGQSIISLSTPGQRAELMIALGNVARDSSRLEHLQITAVRKDGSIFDADCALAYVRESEGFIVWSVRDITHIKQVERLKDQFVSMVSHELRTPLSGMLLSASSLQRYYDRLSDDKRREIIDRLNNQGAVMVELIEGILDLSRLDSRSITPGSTPIDMSKVIEKVTIQLHDSITAKNHTVKQNWNTSTSFVTGSEIDFARVWRNLMSNAIKYTPDGGTITLTLGSLTVIAPSTHNLSPNIAPQSLNLPMDLPEGDYVIGQVEDTGRGIPAGDLDQLFTRFFRGSASQSSTPGTGLGLSLVRELLYLYGGDISVMSQINSGSIFSFWLPINKENAT